MHKAQERFAQNPVCILAPEVGYNISIDNSDPDPKNHSTTISRNNKLVSKLSFSKIANED
jgi:hypothetical protein